MKTILKTGLLLMICFISYPYSALAEDYQKKRVEIKTFTINANTTLNIDNKYGFINIQEWDKNEVRVEVTITVITKKTNRTEEIIKTVHVNYTQSSELISIWTQYDDLNNCNCTRTVDYQIMVPRNIHYKLNNKYGNITMENAHGSVDIDIKYGNLKANDLTGNHSKTITSGYGDINVNKLNGPNNQIQAKYNGLVSVGSANNLSLDIKYSNLKIGNTNKLNILSKYSNVDIEKVKTLNINQSKYEDYKIEEVEEIIAGNVAYTKINIEKIFNSLSISYLKYGELNVNSVEPQFKNISVTASYSPVNIRLNPTTSCKAEAYTEHGKIQIKANKVNTTKKVTEKHSDQIQCTIGDPSSSLIKITNHYSDIRISQ